MANYPIDVYSRPLDNEASMLIAQIVFNVPDTCLTTDHHNVWFNTLSAIQKLDPNINLLYVLHIARLSDNVLLKKSILKIQLQGTLQYTDIETTDNGIPISCGPCKACSIVAPPSLCEPNEIGITTNYQDYPNGISGDYVGDLYYYFAKTVGDVNSLFSEWIASGKPYGGMRINGEWIRITRPTIQTAAELTSTLVSEINYHFQVREIPFETVTQFGVLGNQSPYGLLSPQHLDFADWEGVEDQHGYSSDVFNLLPFYGLSSELVMETTVRAWVSDPVPGEVPGFAGFIIETSDHPTILRMVEVSDYAGDRYWGIRNGIQRTLGQYIHTTTTDGYFTIVPYDGGYGIRGHSLVEVDVEGAMEIKIHRIDPLTFPILLRHDYTDGLLEITPGITFPRAVHSCGIRFSEYTLTAQYPYSAEEA